MANPAASLRAFFDQAAPGWAARQVDYGLLEWLLDRLDWASGQRVLDLGGGTGHLVAALRRRVGAAGRIALVDLSPCMLRHAAAPATAAGALRCCGAAEALPLRPGMWDTVIGMGLYPHLADRDAALAQIAAVLAPQGQLAFMHLIGRQRLNQLHSGMGYPVARHLLPPAVEVAAALRRAGFAVTCALDEEDRYLVAGRRQ